MFHGLTIPFDKQNLLQQLLGNSFECLHGIGGGIPKVTVCVHQRGIMAQWFCTLLPSDNHWSLCSGGAQVSVQIVAPVGKKAGFQDRFQYSEHTEEKVSLVHVVM